MCACMLVHIGWWSRRTVVVKTASKWAYSSSCFFSKQGSVVRLKNNINPSHCYCLQRYSDGAEWKATLRISSNTTHSSQSLVIIPISRIVLNRKPGQWVGVYTGWELVQIISREMGCQRCGMLCSSVPFVYCATMQTHKGGGNGVMLASSTHAVEMKYEVPRHNKTRHRRRIWHGSKHEPSIRLLLNNILSVPLLPSLPPSLFLSVTLSLCLSVSLSFSPSLCSTLMFSNLARTWTVFNWTHLLKEGFFAGVLDNHVDGKSIVHIDEEGICWSLVQSRHICLRDFVKVPGEVRVGSCKKMIKSREWSGLR